MDMPQMHTDTVDFELDLGAQELVPLVDGMDQIATTLEGAGAAERVCERCIGREVGIDCFSLGRESCKSVRNRIYRVEWSRTCSAGEPWHSLCTTPVISSVGLSIASECGDVQ
jgi:hypothetical protein